MPTAAPCGHAVTGCAFIPYNSPFPGIGTAE